ELLAILQARYSNRVAPPIRVNVRLSEATSHGKTIYEYDPRSRGARDYAMLVEHLSSQYGFSAAPPPDAVRSTAQPPPARAAPAPAPLGCRGQELASLRPSAAFANRCRVSGCLLRYLPLPYTDPGPQPASLTQHRFPALRHTHMRCSRPALP
ncbi:MAG TPA: hypothetical protein PKA05_00450, partial [Roseiflexaceae bacterium]|nr:hypothetical protein [Roseiflexaceae bacterium]